MSMRGDTVSKALINQSILHLPFSLHPQSRSFCHRKQSAQSSMLCLCWLFFIAFLSFMFLEVNSREHIPCPVQGVRRDSPAGCSLGSLLAFLCLTHNIHIFWLLRTYPNHVQFCIESGHTVTSANSFGTLECTPCNPCYLNKYTLCCWWVPNHLLPHCQLSISFPKPQWYTQRSGSRFFCISCQWAVYPVHQWTHIFPELPFVLALFVGALLVSLHVSG